MKTDKKHNPIPGDRKPFSDIPGFDDGLVLLPDLGMDFARAEKTVARAMKAHGGKGKPIDDALWRSLARAVNITPPSSHEDVVIKLRMMCGAAGISNAAREDHVVSLRQSLDFIAIGNDAAFVQEIYVAAYVAAQRTRQGRQALSPAIEAGLDAVSDCHAPGVDLEAYLEAIDAGGSHEDALAMAGGAKGPAGRPRG